MRLRGGSSASKGVRSEAPSELAASNRMGDCSRADAAESLLAVLPGAGHRSRLLKTRHATEPKILRRLPIWQLPPTKGSSC